MALAEAMRGVLHDLRYAVRNLGRTPGFTAVVILTLAVGIGANTAIFSVIQGVLLSPLPYREPDRLVRIYRQSDSFARGSVSAPEFVDYKTQSTKLAARRGNSGGDPRLFRGHERSGPARRAW